MPSTVTTLNDAGPGSLRDAIATTPAGGTVDFQSGLTGVIALTSATLTVDHNLTITGPGAKTITVSGNQQFPLFTVSSGVTAAITGMSIKEQGTITFVAGGGILNRGTLTVSGCVVSGFSSGGNPGPAGGIANYGTLTVTASTVSNNGGSSLSHFATSLGGGIYNDATGTLTVLNSTVSGNNADRGGGIYSAGALTVINATVSRNSAGSIAGLGAGGIYSAGGSLNLANTIVAGNRAGGMFAPDDLIGTVNVADHNLIGDGNGSSGLVNGQNGNQVGTTANPIDPKLGALRDNGGPTPTLALFAGSPAIDAGDNAAFSGTTDQRGLPRVVHGTMDIGAYEVQASTQGKPIFALGGAPGRVRVHAVLDGGLVADFAPYGAAYTGPVNVAVGDINGDGIPDLVTAAAVGNPDVRVFDGKGFADGSFDNNNPGASLIAQWFPYALQFNVGATVAVGDVEHDGFADIVTGADVGNPDVRVYRGKDIAQGTFDPAGSSLIAQWFPYALNFNVGANVAVGDVTGDGFADVVTGATAGNPDVRVYNGKDIARGTFDPTGASLLAQFFPYALQFNVGAFVAVGDTTGSGFGDVITGASVGNPDVRVYSGQAIATGTFNNANPDASRRDEFFAYALNFNIGVTVASADFEGTGKFDILTGASVGSPQYRVIAGNASGTPPPALFEDFAQGIQGGIAVGA